jgi:O-antigen/teichoic acid export membrane protein
MFQGVLQGERRFGELAALLAAAGLGRSACGLLGLVIAHNSTGAVLAILLGVTACAGVVSVPLRDEIANGSAREPLREVAYALHAHGSFWFLSTVDVLLARHVLSSHLAAVYATGSVVTRGTIWLPQSVATLVFPRLTDAERHHQMLRRAVVIVAGAGAVVTLSVAAVPTLVSRVVGGGRYPELVPSCWLFAVLGASLAVLQLGMVAGLALRRTRQTALIWAAVVADTVLVLAAGAGATVGRVVLTVALTTAFAAVGSVLVGTGWPARAPRPGQLADPSGQAPAT